MANGRTYGVTFPFKESYDGKYLDTTELDTEEIRSNLIHLLLTRKGSRYFLPDFGSRLYEYIFEPLDGPTFNQIEAEIRDSVEKYIPNLLINKVSVYAATDDLVESVAQAGVNTFNLPGRNSVEYTAKVKIDYTITSNVFNPSDFIIINI